jgi:hypothetical protein
LATPGGSPKSWRVWIKLPCRSIPEFIFILEVELM